MLPLGTAVTLPRTRGRLAASRAGAAAPACTASTARLLRRALRAVLLAGIALAAGAALAQAPAPRYVPIPAGSYASVLKLDDVGLQQSVGAFSLMDRPVSNRDFLAFVTTHPQWRRGAAPTVFADGAYLGHWASPLALGDSETPEQPVTQVSWFAATAYCEAQGGRLPTWAEWEYVAAADETRTDARADPAWRERILGWYSRPSGAPLPAVAGTPANAYGVHDVHGLVWEWVDDFNALMVSADNRKQGDPDILKFCGAGAISMADRENYAVLMRTAMLSALGADSTTRNMGFRCARDADASITN